ncbi:MULTISPECIES: ferrochelatase [unclassified Methylobacterium]|uniref:ferrochelatase n=1 Tax=unclassified Methylobacterium TaxID=2615210 RepID=UPI002269FD72|nr:MULTISPECIES: ferrochelatase [unclassified Methylobacterium]
MNERVEPAAALANGRPLAPREPAAATLPADHPKVAWGRVGVLLMNLGTPEGTSYWPMRRYLKEFLSDRRVIEVSRLIWWPLLNLIILTKRPGPKGRDYASVWNNALNEGPLKTTTRGQSERLQAAMGDTVVVDWAMRYGKPEVAGRIQALLDQGCDRILLVPLYPQYAAATSATACDQAFRALMDMRWQPTVRVSPPYHDDPVYIAAMADSIREGLAKLDFEPEVILTSFHGVPRSYLLKGDPYHCQCHKTGRLIREALGMSPEKMRVTFQSRFGNEEWLKPYTDETVMDLAKSGVKRMAIVAPGFTADCLETLEELDGENRHYFEDNGGERFAYIPCLNDSDLGMKVIEHVVRRELQGWI